jgi:hypothetical protein
MHLQGWQWGYIILVMGASLLVSVYVEARRLLYAAVDDRYGEWARFWWEAGQPGAAKTGADKFRFLTAFVFCYGLHDLWRLITLVAFDWFIVFAILSPFWRHVFFEDFNGVLAAILGLAGSAVFLYWKVKHTLPLCRLHQWSQQSGRCERCGEGYVEPEPAGRLSWHGFWQRQVNRLVQPPSTR